MSIPLDVAILPTNLADIFIKNKGTYQDLMWEFKWMELV